MDYSVPIIGWIFIGSASFALLSAGISLLVMAIRD